MSWTTARADIRQLLADGPTDKLAYRKKLVGVQDGTAKRFKTFENRRVTDFLTAVAPLGVYVDGALVPVAADDMAVGEFELVTAPTNSQTLEASYYIQWFNDDELDTFLAQASQWTGLGADVTNIPVGLRPAILEYSACLGYRRLALWWSRAISETYMYQDAPSKDRFAIVDSYTKMAEAHCGRAEAIRNDYWSRQGQSNAPLFGVIQGSVRDVPPNR